MVIDFGMLPPEINSGRMYTGAGSGPLLAVAATWDALAAELHSAAALYSSAISGLLTLWQGTASLTMATAAAPYGAWMSATAVRAEQTATQAKVAAAAFETAFAATVPPSVIAANRAQLLTLVATNFFGQNAPAIMATQAEYGEMWAQDAAAMYGYAGSSAAASQLAPFRPPPQITNPGGSAGQAAAVGRATGTVSGAHAQALPQLMTATHSSLRSLANPLAATVPSADPPSPSSLASSLSNLNSFITGPLSPLSLFSIGGTPELLGAQCYLLPQAGVNLTSAADKLAATPAASGAGLVLSPTPALGTGVSAGLGRAGLVGGLSVPQGWAAAAPAVKPVAAVFAETSPAGSAVAAAAPGEGTLFGNTALSSLAGRAIAGSGDTPARSAGAGLGPAAAEASGPVNIFIVPAAPQ